MTAPGELGSYDRAYVAKQAAAIRNVTHKWFRARIEGFAHVPDAPFVAVGNHSGGTLIPDTLVWVSAYHVSGRRTPLLTLAHPGIFSFYPKRLARSLARLGAIRADPRLALQALRAGNAVQVYPGGDIDACRPFRRRNRIVFDGHRGYVKLAQKAGVPIVPVVSLGAHEALIVLWDGAPLARFLGLDRRFRLKALPLSLCLPWGLWLGPLPGYLPLPTKIVVRVLPPIDPAGDVDEIDRRVRDAMQTALDDMAHGRRFLGAGS